MQNYNNLFSYKGVPYIFPSFDGKHAPKGKDRVKVICSCCHQEKDVSYTALKNNVTSLNNFICFECKRDSKRYTVEDFPSELQLILVSGGVENKYLTAEQPVTVISFICQDCGKREILSFKYFLKRYKRYGKFLCKSCGTLFTLKKKYGEGIINVGQLPNHKEKMEKSSLLKFNLPYYTQTEEYQQRAFKKYKYKGINFDSSWELAYYIYNEDHNIPTIRLPQSIEYFLNEESHHYFPDFLVGDQLIEIKNSAMLNLDCSLKPYQKLLNRCQTEEEKQHLYDLCAAKTQCMRENNVQIISDKEIKPYLKYIKNAYGKNYLKQFKKEDDRDNSEEIDILDEDIEDINELD